jgi:hypothetical protein
MNGGTAVPLVMRQRLSGTEASLWPMLRNEEDWKTATCRKTATNVCGSGDAANGGHRCSVVLVVE